MDVSPQRPIRGLAPLFLYPVLACQTVGAAVFLWLQPGGFSFGSRSFIEHQVIAPALFAVALATSIAARSHPSVALLGVGILAGFWVAAGGIVLIAGTTGYAVAMALAVAGAFLMLLLALRTWPGPPRRPLWIGTLAGIALGCAFWACAWAPPASTRPSGGVLDRRRPVERPPLLEKDGVSVVVRFAGACVTVTAPGGASVDVWPTPSFHAVADSGTWSLFDFRSTHPGKWEVSRVEGDALEVGISCTDFDSLTRIWIAGRQVRMRVTTALHREISAHLASALTLRLPGEPTIDSHRWNPGDPSEFVAFRGGRVELLRATEREKGPFETLASWSSQDPVLEAGGWRVQVLGWADQASRAESPTAGWGVSQGAIERVGDEFIWEFAATSVGRGWHTVRTAPGTYVLEVVLSPP